MPLVIRKNQMTEGPWLDRLFPIKLADGRMASVTSFSVLPSNIGILEGGMDSEINASQRQTIRAIALRKHGGPVHELEPVIEAVPEVSTRRPRERLPWMACMARITSRPLDSCMVSSELTLVWWQDVFELPLPQEVERAASGLAWERLAEDVDLP